MKGETETGSKATPARANGAGGNGATAEAMIVAAGGPDAETVKKLAPQIAEVRVQVRESFGRVVMSMMPPPRYRNQTLDDPETLQKPGTQKMAEHIAGQSRTGSSEGLRPRHGSAATSPAEQPAALIWTSSAANPGATIEIQDVPLRHDRACPSRR